MISFRAATWVMNMVSGPTHQFSEQVSAWYWYATHPRGTPTVSPPGNCG